MCFSHLFCFSRWITEWAPSKPVRGTFLVSSWEYQQVLSEASRGMAVLIAVINGRPKIPAVIYSKSVTYPDWIRKLESKPRALVS